MRKLTRQSIQRRSGSPAWWSCCSAPSPWRLSAAASVRRRRRRHRQHDPPQRPRTRRPPFRRTPRPRQPTPPAPPLGGDTTTIRVYFSRNEKICAATRVDPEDPAGRRSRHEGAHRGSDGRRTAGRHGQQPARGDDLPRPRHRERRGHRGSLQGVRVGRRQPLHVHATGRGGLHAHAVPHGRGCQLQARRRADRRARW